MFRRYVENLNEFLCNLTKKSKTRHFSLSCRARWSKSKFNLTISKINFIIGNMWGKNVNFNDILPFLNVNKMEKNEKPDFLARFLGGRKRKKRRFSQSACGFCAIFLLDFGHQMC